MLFKYRAKTPQGALKQGEIAASSQSLAIDTLQRQGYILLSLTAVEEGNFFERMLGIGKPRLKDIMILSRQLAILFSADVPILSSLKAVTEQTENKAMKGLLREVTDDVNGGLPLSAAFEKHRGVFGDFYISLVRSGEASGRLSQVLEHLADYLERSHQLVTKARNAMIYPAFILAAFVGVVVLLLSVVMPKLQEMFEESGVTLPLFTRMIIGAGVFLSNNGWWVLVVFLGLIAFLIYYLKTETGREMWHRLQLRIPVFGNLFQKFYVARFADNFSTLIVSGIPIIRSLEIVADVVENVVYRDIVLKAAESIRGGGTVSEAFQPYIEIPPLVVQMISIGEQTGKLDYILEKISAFYIREVQNIVDNLVTLIEPILILVIGAMVGLLVAGVLLPIYDLAGSI